ncbi:MAG: ABC transporter ATP-binding protein [Anaerolineales bacterium]
MGVQQRVEIIKVLYREADILILDEPTAVLTPQEVDELFKVIRSLVDRGKSVIFITHKLKEVMAIADRITVLRNGHVVGEATPDTASEASLAKMMVGREVIMAADRKPQAAGDVVLDVQNLIVRDDRDLVAVDGVSFQLRQGEILGVAGVQGNGQTELVESLTGLRSVEGGKITILGQDTTNSTPRKIREVGTAHVPEDRQQDGLVLSFPVADNLVLNTYYEPPFAKGINLQQDAIEEAAESRVELFDIRTPSIFVPVANLSGGNQQKVIVAREFSRPVSVLIASQPTRGLDVGSIEYIHSRILEKRDEGCGVLLVSPELDEIMNLSDRIAVMFEGKVVAILDAADATKEKLGLLMAGLREEAAVEAGNPQKG